MNTFANAQQEYRGYPPADYKYPQNSYMYHNPGPVSYVEDERIPQPFQPIQSGLSHLAYGSAQFPNPQCSLGFPQPQYQAPPYSESPQASSNISSPVSTTSAHPFDGAFGGNAPPFVDYQPYMTAPGQYPRSEYEIAAERYPPVQSFETGYLHQPQREPGFYNSGPGEPGCFAFGQPGPKW